MTSPRIGIVVVNVYFFASVILAFVGVPARVWWLRQHEPKCIEGNIIVAAFSGIAWALALASAVLYVTSIMAAQLHRFPYYDPTLMHIFSAGFWLAFAGFVFGAASVWRARRIRWGAGTLSALMLLLWFGAAMGE